MILIRGLLIIGQNPSDLFVRPCVAEKPTPFSPSLRPNIVYLRYSKPHSFTVLSVVLRYPQCLKPPP